MSNEYDFMLSGVDYVLVVNRDFDIVYNSRYDTRTMNKPTKQQKVNFFDNYPSVDRAESTVYKAIAHGETTFLDRQEFTDATGKIFVTQNLTFPLYERGKIAGAVEVTRDVTTIGMVNRKEEYRRQLAQKQKRVRAASEEKITFDNIITINEQMLQAIDQAKIFASTPNPTLIYGETGTGKELFAQAMINYVIGPKQKSVVQNCAAIPENLCESILFGTVKGSYTGAENHKGLFEEADKGIFFLDEINALPYVVQGKLLRVLQDGTYRPIGSNVEKRANVKVIAAMNVDPMKAIEENIMRKDLFYRLSGNMIYLPPLRERKDDIEFLTDHYIDIYNEMYNKNVKGISEELRNFFLTYHWEGNVRELIHILEAMVSMSTHDVLQYEELPVYINRENTSNQEGEVTVDSEDQIVVDIEEENYDLRNVVDKVERDLIKKAITKCHGNKTKAGEMLGIPRQTLKYKMEKLDINKDL